jgi:CelD/BcsL family acetyltransferase involved in cellulose biosynthesis
MHIDEISPGNFAAVAADWDRAYDADPEAHFFLSHEWLRDGLDYRGFRWFVLAARRGRADEGYCAFMPLRIQPKFDAHRGFYNQIDLAGSTFSDYAGLIARPDDEADAIAAFVHHLKTEQHWAVFVADNLLMSDRRLKLFQGAFGKARFSTTPIQYIDALDQTNHGICPYISLPSDWDTYLAGLSSNNRQKIRRLLRKVDDSDVVRIAFSTADEVEHDLDTLLGYWTTKWLPSKGDKTAEIVRRNRRMLLRCARENQLLLGVFRHGERVVAAVASLIDHRKQSILFVITGRDEQYEEMPAGYLLHAHCIRHAISAGFRTYDFLMGNEPYKYLFTKQDRMLSGMRVETRTGHNVGRELDKECLPEMIRLAVDLDDRNEPAQAEAAYRAILEMAPDDAFVLYRLGRMLAKRENFQGASEWLQRSVEQEPEGDNAWLWLARARAALGEAKAAIAAYMRVLDLQPGNEDARKEIVRLRMQGMPDLQRSFVASAQREGPTWKSFSAEGHRRA